MSLCDKKLGHMITKTQNTHILNSRFTFRITHWPEPVATYVFAIFNKERLQVSKGSDHFDLSLEPTGLLSSSQIF